MMDAREVDNLWNLWATKAAPTCTVQGNVRHREINTMKAAITEAVGGMSTTQPVLHREAAVLSRYLYRYKRTFRHDKGLQYLSQVLQALKRCLRLDLLSTLNDFKSCLPSRENAKAERTWLPTQQMLQFLLLRLQAHGKLMLRLRAVTQCAAEYLLGKYELGWSCSHTTLCLSLAARLHACARHLLVLTIDTYNTLLPCMPALRHTLQQQDYLPGHVFPRDLHAWLGSPALQRPRSTSATTPKTSMDIVFEMIDLAGSDDDDVMVMPEDLGDQEDVISAGQSSQWTSSQMIQKKGKRIKIEEEEEEEVQGGTALAVAWSTQDVGTPVERAAGSRKRKDPTSKNHGRKKKRD